METKIVKQVKVILSPIEAQAVFELIGKTNTLTRISMLKEGSQKSQSEAQAQAELLGKLYLKYSQEVDDDDN